MRNTLILSMAVAACGGAKATPDEAPPMVANAPGPSAADEPTERPIEEPVPAEPTNPPALGTLEKPVIKKHMGSETSRIEVCYQEALAEDPTLQGTVYVTFTIGTDGRVLQASGDGFPHPGVTACIVDVVKGIQFPRPQGDGVVQVRYPFTLRPAEE